MPAPDAPDLDALEQDYQTHCVWCFQGLLEHCEGGMAPNGQPCATTPAQRIAYLLYVVQHVVAQRNAAEAREAKLMAALEVFPCPVCRGKGTIYHHTVDRRRPCASCQGTGQDPHARAALQVARAAPEAPERSE